MKYFSILLISLASILLVQGATDKVICYYGSWAHYRAGNARASVSDLDPKLCTHIIYSFVGINSTGGIVILDPWLDVSLGGIQNTVALKNVNPKLKVLVAIGGFDQGGYTFSVVAESPSLRAKFVQNVVNFINQYKLDGFDIDWEYPAGNGGRPQDKQNFALLLQQLRAALNPLGKILSAAVGASRLQRETYYNVPALNQYLDFINIMAYDLHGSWDGRTGQNAPLYASSVDTNNDLNINAIVQQWINAGASPSKLVLGLALYGHSFTLASSSNNGIGAPITGPGNPGPHLKEAGSLSYLEICSNNKFNGWYTVYDNQQQVPYAYKGNQWVGYDNIVSLQKKIDLAKTKQLAGAMVWSLDHDDIRNVCGNGTWTLMKAIRRGLGLVFRPNDDVDIDESHLP